MARLKGPILFTGSLGNIRSFYDSKRRRYIIATKGGASKQLILSSPVFARTRENMSEFGACGKIASQLRRSLLPLSHLFWGTYFGEIVKMAKEIQLHDEINPKGVRSIEPSKVRKSYLINLEFNKRHSFTSVLYYPPDITLSEDKKTVTLDIPGFRPDRNLRWKGRVDSYRMALVIAQLPDWAYSELALDYVPVIRELEQQTVTIYTPWMPNDTEPVDIHLEASFAEPALQQPGTTVVVAMGIETSSQFLKPTDTYVSHMGTMKIVECFV